MHLQEKTLESYLTLLTKINSKRIKVLNVTHKNVKLLGKTKGFLTLVLAVIFWMNQKQTTKAKINKPDYIKLKSFCIAKKAINKMRKYL